MVTQRDAAGYCVFKLSKQLLGLESRAVQSVSSSKDPLIFFTEPVASIESRNIKVVLGTCY